MSVSECIYWEQPSDDLRVGPCGECARCIAPDQFVRDLTTCESSAAITIHLRDLVLVPANYQGHPRPGPEALCGSEIAWDTKSPIQFARCNACRKLAHVELAA